MFNKIQRMNRFFSLPDVLISKIYEYDNTYRIFGTSQFTEVRN